ncbi:pali-domain-containing protein [Sistotremastrum suecicum HHB10207 ss-3]|uniref:Pali-domain-containing protein n=1 Tax=Sistotremastrum suecicum HHB10207 ss-3 TaxID=1314776 RepID=A0A166IGT0_9AGAM|nr:pali-domain-containing protein [Sistotremastrum suecicum HHB10207 ss-3]
MSILRPATPGFLITLIATIILLVVSFSVPWFKSIYFLKANISIDKQSGYITFGVLGYCTSINNAAANCTKAQLGYEFDPNTLLGDNSKLLQIPIIVTKWITWTFVLHIVALILAAIASFFGLLAHVREMSMTCFSSCISGFAAFVTLVAFIFDLVLFFVAKARINDVHAGSATIGIGVWLTLAAWILLFFSGCVYSLGRCCLSRRPRGPSANNDRWMAPAESNYAPPKDNFADSMRLDAVKAEADRKARAAAGERGLPAFPGPDEIKPLSSYEATYAEEEHEHEDLPYRDENASQPARTPSGQRQGNNRTPGPPGSPTCSSSAYATGYTPGPRGQRTVDGCYDRPQQAPANQPTYPPQSPPRRTPGPQDRQQSASPANYAGMGAGAPAWPNAQNPQSQYSSSPGPYGRDQWQTPNSTAVYANQAPVPQSSSTYYPARSQPQDFSAYQQTQPSAGYPQAHGSESYGTAYGAAAYPQHQNSYPPPVQNNYVQPPSAVAPQGYSYADPYASTSANLAPPLDRSNSSSPSIYSIPNPHSGYDHDANNTTSIAYAQDAYTSMPAPNDTAHSAYPSRIDTSYVTPPTAQPLSAGPRGPRSIPSPGDAPSGSERPPDYSTGGYARPAGWAEKR